MDNLNHADVIEQRIQSFHAGLRANFSAKVQEVAKLHDEMAKLQIRLLDVEQENHMLKIQLAMAKAEDKGEERHELQSTSAPPVKNGGKKPMPAEADGSLKPFQPPLKRARSPSLEIVEVNKPSPKRFKPEVKAESPASSHGAAARKECNENHSPRENRSPSISHSPISSNVGTASTARSSTPLPDSKKLKFKRQKSENLNDFSLLQSVADTYLQGAQTLEIHPPPLDLEVSREFLRVSYGGSDRKFLQDVKPERNPSGPFLRRLVFPRPELNPFMPSHPGDPGLVFASRHEILSNPPSTLFYKHVKDKVRWKYQGEYKGIRVGTITADDFKAQTAVVQRQWARQILKQKMVDAYVSMHARIALRLTSIIPVDDKEKEARIVQREVKAIRMNKGRPISEEDIIDAFGRGDEGIDIILMTCVKYDHVFANSMKALLTNPPTTSANANKANASGSKSMRGSRTNQASTSSASKGRRVTTIISPVKAEESARPKRLRKASRKIIESMTGYSGGSTNEERSSD